MKERMNELINIINEADKAILFPFSFNNRYICCSELI